MGIRVVPRRRRESPQRARETVSKITGTPAERRADREKLDESLKAASKWKVSDKMIREMLEKGSRNVSDRDRDLVETLHRNDGGIARKTRVF